MSKYLTQRLPMSKGEAAFDALLEEKFAIRTNFCVDSVYLSRMI